MSLVAINRLHITQQLQYELQKKILNFDKLKLINTILRQELEPFDVHHKLALQNQISFLQVNAITNSDEIVNKIPNFIKESIYFELEHI